MVVDIIPPDSSGPPSPPRKKQNKLRALLVRIKSLNSSSKLSKKLSAVGVVEELFEEGSAMLAERSVFLLLMVLISVNMVSSFFFSLQHILLLHSSFIVDSILFLVWLADK